MQEKGILQEFISYRKKLENSRKTRSPEVFFNDSDIHEEFVMKELFANAVESNPRIQTIYMYCGRMSAFRDAMRDKVEEIKLALKPHEGSSQDENDEWNDFNPYAKMIDRMKSFFVAGGNLEIIVDDDVSSIVNEQIWRDTLSRYYNETNQLSISRLLSKCGVEHFIVSGKAYRSELSHKDKTALCCFNDADYSGLLYSNFSFLQKKSRPAII